VENAFFLQFDVGFQIFIGLLDYLSTIHDFTMFTLF